MANVVRISLEIELTLLDIGLHLIGAKNALLRTLRGLKDTLEVIQMLEVETAGLREQAKRCDKAARSNGNCIHAIGQACFKRGHFCP